MKWYPFSEVISDVTSKFKKIKASEYRNSGRYKIVDQGKGEIAGYIDNKELVNTDLLPVIIFGDHTRILKYVDTPIALGADGAKALKVNHQLANPLYIYYYLRTIKLKNAGYSRHFKFLQEINIPILEINGEPDFENQKRIACLLGKVEGLIAQRKQHLQQLDDLLKSVFLEMFGDPSRNEKKWDMDYLGNLTSEKIGYGIVQPGNPVELGVPVIRVGDFVGTKIDTKNITKVSEEISQRHKNSILKGDEILLACVGATIGKVAVVERIHAGYNIVRATARIRPSQDINRLFLAYLLLSDYAQNYYLKVTRSVGQPTLNIKQIEELPVITPPIHIQNQFAITVEKVEGIKSRYQENLNDLENLYGALSQKAFKGELYLSRVPLTSESTEATAEENPETNEPSPTTDAFELPAPSNLATLNSVEGRNALLDQWLTLWFERLNDTPFSTQPFMEAAQQRFWKLAEDAIQQRLWELAEDNTLDLGAAEYDYVRSWIFESLDKGRLAQTYDDANNHVQLMAAGN